MGDKIWYCHNLFYLWYEQFGNATIVGSSDEAIIVKNLWNCLKFAFLVLEKKIPLSFILLTNLKLKTCFVQHIFKRESHFVPSRRKYVKFIHISVRDWKWNTPGFPFKLIFCALRFLIHNTVIFVQNTNWIPYAK